MAGNLLNQPADQSGNKSPVFDAYSFVDKQGNLQIGTHRVLLKDGSFKANTGSDMFWQQHHPRRPHLRQPSQWGAFSLLLWVGFIALLFWTNGSKADERPSINVTRAGNGVTISAAAIIRAPASLIWDTLTDYNHLASFIPGMTKSRVIARRGTVATVEQEGTAAILAFSYPIHVTVEADERRPTTINLRMVNGNFRQFGGIYRIDKIEDDIFTLSWAGIVEPEIFLPPDVSALLLRSNIADQFLGMVREIERREAVRLNH